MSTSSKDRLSPDSGNPADIPAALTRRHVLGGLTAAAVASPLLSAVMNAPAFAQTDANGEPVRGGTLVYAISADPGTSNQVSTTGATDHMLAGLIYEGLTTIAEDFSPQPCLAESWEISEDGLTFTFHLVEARWHDGEEFTSSDVKFTLEEVTPNYSARFSAVAEIIESIETPDDRTVIIKLSSPYGPFLFSLSAYVGANILPEHLFRDTNVLDNPASLEAPVGTGPFKLTQWVRGDRIVLDRNPDYWQADLPYLDQIIIRIIPDGNSRVLALQSGEVDFVYYYFYPPSRVQEAINDPRLQTREQSIPQTKVLIFNLREAPFDDVRVREAVFRATNRSHIKQIVYHNLGNMMKNHMDSRLAWAHDPDIDLDEMYPYDIEAAAALLDEAGYPADSRGHRFDVRLAYDSTDPEWGRMAQILAAMWSEVGINVVYQGNPRAVMLEQVFTDWNFDVTLQAYSTAGDPALGVARLYVSSAIEKRPFLNVSGYSNPEVDALFSDGMTESTTEGRGGAYKAVAPILARDIPLLPLWETASFNVASADVKGPWAYSTGYTHWESVWIER